MDSTSNINDATSVPVVEAKIALNKNHVIPDEVVCNIARILKVYKIGVNIENFKFIYNILYYDILSPEVFGFISSEEFFKVLFYMVEIRNNVLYPKSEFKLYEQMDFKNSNINTQECLKSTICLKNEGKICMNIKQASLSLNREKSKIKTVLSAIYNPSLFYLQLGNMIEEFDSLMKQMQIFYETRNQSYTVKPSQVLIGFCYASSYTSFLHPKQWYRLRILREINKFTVEIIHVDYGTVDNIPKTKLRFLKKDFCYLPCQAIHCCLTGYNLNTTTPKITKAFVKIIDMNKQTFFMVDHHFMLSNQYQILHITLFQHKLISNKLENINNKLAVWQLKHEEFTPFTDNLN